MGRVSTSILGLLLTHTQLRLSNSRRASKLYEDKAMSLELVSFSICPFVQRSVIALKEKQVPFEVTYIDLHNPPEWFNEISPFGKVPLLKVEGEVLFESAIIGDYLDEVFAPQLHPENPLTRAKHRGWIEFGSSLLFDQVKIVLAKNEDEYQQAIEAFSGSLARLNDQVGDGPYFSGEKFTLLDASYAPFFMRFQLLCKYRDDLIDTMPQKLQNWSRALLDRETVKDSVMDNFESEYIAFFKPKGSMILADVK